MLSPIQIILKANNGGNLATIFYDLDQPSVPYDPSAPGVYTPPLPSQFDVRGAFQRNPQTGLVTTKTSQFLFALSAPVVGLQSARVEVLVKGTKYLALEVRERHYRAEFDGYSMELQKGP